MNERRNIRIGFLNIHGLRNTAISTESISERINFSHEQNVVIYLMSKYDLDILSLCETWEREIELKCEDYKIIANIPGTRSMVGGRYTDGMCVIARKNTVIQEIICDRNKIIIKHECIYLWFIYCKHAQQLRMIEYLNEQITGENGIDHILVGDFNLNSNISLRNELKELMFEKNIFEYPLKTFTYKCGNTKTQPDRLFTNMLVNAEVQPYDQDISDHRMIVTTIRDHINSEEKPMYAFARLKDDNTSKRVKEKLATMTDRMLREVTPEVLSINDLYDLFENVITMSISQLKRRNDNSRMMMPTEIRRLITQRNRLRRNTERNIDELRALRAVIKREIRKFKSSSYPRPRENIDTISGNCYEVAKIMKRSTNNVTKTKLTREEMKITLANSYPDRVGEPYNIDSCDLSTPDIERIDKVELEELELQIKMMCNGKSTGPSFINAELLKILPRNTLYILKVLFDKILMEKTIPEKWKLIRLALIPKGNNEFRPIGIMNQARKLFEKIFLARIENKLRFCSQQGGFVKGLGTQNHALIMDGMLRRSNGKAAVITIDIRKAYDTVDRLLLYAKLKNRFSLSTAHIEILYELLENNTVEVVQGTMREHKHLGLGLPQGCVLSPVLFNAFIDDLIDYIRPGDRQSILIYADDIAIAHSNTESIYSMIEGIEKHSYDNNYRLNPGKCHLMTRNPAQFMIYGAEIARTNVIKYLGYMYNLKGLDMESNIQIIRAKIFGRAAMLKRFVTSSNIINPRHANIPRTLQQVYKTYCRPLIDYPLALMCSFKYVRERCETIQRGILKYLTGITHRIPTTILYSIVRIETVAFRGIRLTNSLRIRSEICEHNTRYAGWYSRENTRIVKFVKSTVEVHEEIKNRREAIENHIQNQDKTGGFSITNITNKKMFEEFIRLINIRIKCERDNEEIEDIIIRYISSIKERYRNPNIP